MRKHTNTQKATIRIGMYLYAVIVLLSLFSVASYTWFSLSKTPTVSDMALYINAPVGMELATAADAEEWVRQLDFSKLLDNEGVLKPATWSDKDQTFYAVFYGLDGRMKDEMERLNDDRHANKDNADGYYILGTFFARTDQPTAVALSPAVEVEEGLQGSGTYVIGTPVWDGQYVVHDNGGHGAEKAIRIGIRIQKTDPEGNNTDEPSLFYIYEPNCDTHLDDSTEYIATPSIDGGDSLIDDAHLIRQTASTWTEAYPVQKNVVIRTLGEFETDPYLFQLRKNELAKISIYVWLEGQDVDCTNEIGHEAQILASIQFTTDTSGQSGLTEIE